MRSSLLTLLAGALLLAGATTLGYALGAFNASDPTVTTPPTVVRTVDRVPLTEPVGPATPIIVPSTDGP